MKRDAAKSLAEILVLLKLLAVFYGAVRNAIVKSSLPPLQKLEL